MKNFNVNRKQIWGVALLTALVGAPSMMKVAKAAPDPNPPVKGSNDLSLNNRPNTSMTGTVTAVRSNNSFSFREGKQRYNVSTTSSLPRGLSVGDKVRVIGERVGHSNLQHARVSLLSDNRPDRDRDRDSPGNSYDSYRTYRGTVEILLPNNEFNARINGRIYKVYATASTRDLRVGDSISIYGQLDRGVNIRNARITRERDNRPDTNNQRGFDTYSGEVTAVKNDREFNVRINGRDYDVYADNSSRRVNRGDSVRIYGKRVGNNDIRESRVVVTRPSYGDRYDNDRYDNDNYGSYRTYNGVVTRVSNDREFEARIDGRTYKVSTSLTVRDLDRGDEVRIYGRSYGSNEIRQANVRVTRQGNAGNERRVTLEGVVTRVRSDREFDVVVDRKTYNVRTNTVTSDVKRGNEVRIYGQRYNDYDIRNANVYLTHNR